MTYNLYKDSESILNAIQQHYVNDGVVRMLSRRCTNYPEWSAAQLFEEALIAQNHSDGWRLALSIYKKIASYLDDQQEREALIAIARVESNRDEVQPSNRRRDEYIKEADIENFLASIEKPLDRALHYLAVACGATRNCLARQGTDFSRMNEGIIIVGERTSRSAPKGGEIEFDAGYYFDAIDPDNVLAQAPHKVLSVEVNPVYTLQELRTSYGRHLLNSGLPFDVIAEKMRLDQVPDKVAA